MEIYLVMSSVGGVIYFTGSEFYVAGYCYTVPRIISELIRQLRAPQLNLTWIWLMPYTPEHNSLDHIHLSGGVGESTGHRLLRIYIFNVRASFSSSLA